jgi:hypothetical protein
MKVKQALVLAAIATVLAVPVAGADKSVATARGNVDWVIPLPNDFGVEVANVLSFQARKLPNGSATGHVKYVQTVEGVAVHFKLDVTCMGIYDNGTRAKIGGVVTKSDDPTVPVGTFGWFQVFDNDNLDATDQQGEEPADRSSLLGFGDEAANEAFCNSPKLPRFGPWDVHGDISVQA